MEELRIAVMKALNEMELKRRSERIKRGKEAAKARKAAAGLLRVGNEKRINK